MGLVLAPAVGDYLTDGKRLVMVLGIDRDGSYSAEDAISDTIVTIAPEHISAWRVLDRGQRPDDPGT